MLARVLRGEPPHSTREGRVQAAAKVEPPAPPSTAPKTIGEAVDRYLEDCASRGNAKSTCDAQRHKLVHVVDVVGNESIETAGEAEASRVRTAMRAAGYSVATINQALAVYASMLGRAHALRWRSTPPGKIERVRDRQPPKPKAYDDGTFEAIVVAAKKDGPATLAIVLVAGEAGLRVGEVQGLEVRDVNLERSELRVERAVGPTGEIGPPKSGEIRTVPLTPRLVEALRPLVEGRPLGAPVFPGKYGGRISRPGVRHKLERVQAKVGLETKGLHALRHTCATSALTNGADPVAVQKLLGHRALRTTIDAYLHASEDAPQRAVAALARGRSVAATGGTDLAQAPATRGMARKRKAKK